MKGARLLAMTLVLSILSACAGAPRQDAVVDADTPSRASPSAYAEAVGDSTPEATDSDDLLLRRNVVAAAHRNPRYGHSRDVHHEPSPGQRYAAEVAFLITAQVFVCSFVVVVLNGHCDLHVSTGFYY